MTETQEAAEFNAVPHDPAMAAADPAMFASMTRDENKILHALTTYVLEAPYGYPAEMSDADASAAYDAYAGYSAFLDRGQAETIAEARGDGLTGHWDYTPAREMRGADEEFTAGLDDLPEAES